MSKVTIEMKEKEVKKPTSHCPLHTSQRGITLIALVITIIVMLILVSVTISMAINGGLFEYAGKATGDTKNAINAEQQLANGHIVVNGKEYASIDDFLENKVIVDKGDRVPTGKKGIYTQGEKTAVIPGGFTVSGVPSESTIDGGLVIYLINDKTEEQINAIDWTDEETVDELQRTYDQFVWIPVTEIDTMVETFTAPPDGIRAGETYYQGKSYSYSGTTATEITDHGLGTTFYREPTLVTDNSEDKYIKKEKYLGWKYDASISYYSTFLGFSTATEFGEHMLNNYQKMVESVEEYKGFYVGRYETSLNGTTVQSQAGQTPMGYRDWYEMYYYQDSTRNISNPYYGSSSSVVSSMISGSQWDAMLNFILTNTNDDGTGNTVASHVTSTTNVSHNSSRYRTGGTDYTGTITYNDIANNIYDLEGNVREWTTEADRYRPSRFSRGQLLLRRFCVGSL